MYTSTNLLKLLHVLFKFDGHLCHSLLIPATPCSLQVLQNLMILIGFKKFRGLVHRSILELLRFIQKIPSFVVLKEKEGLQHSTMHLQLKAIEFLYKKLVEYSKDDSIIFYNY